MAKFFEFWMYSIIGIAISQVIRVAFLDSGIAYKTVFDHLYFGILTTATYHWFINATKDVHEKT